MSGNIVIVGLDILVGANKSSSISFKSFAINTFILL